MKDALATIGCGLLWMLMSLPALLTGELGAGAVGLSIGLIIIVGAFIGSPPVRANEVRFVRESDADEAGG